jgi:PAS domain S-box-containing protein
MTTPRPTPRRPQDATKSKKRAVRTSPPPTQSKLELQHELRVHRVELEQQNEELRRAHVDLTAARDRYIDLFDFAPVGYLTLDLEGRIMEANLTAAAALGMDRRAMLGSPFVRLVAPPDADRWQRLTAAAFRQGDPRRIELSLVRQDGGRFHAQADCHRIVPPGTKAQLRVTLTDVSLRHLAERNRRIANTAAVARAAERRTTAFQLHEDLGQRLGMLKMHLSALALPPDCETASAAVLAMTSEVDRALMLVRRMSADLHPLMLENLGLNAALEWLVGDVASRLGLTAELHIGEDSVPMDDSLALAVYRLIEMALEHFGLHVDAGIDIELLQRPGDLVLQFQSAPGHARPGSNTGAMMEMSEAFRDQVHLLGARLELDELAEGTHRLSVFIDLEPRRARPAAIDNTP